MNGLEFLRLVLPQRGWYVGFATKTDQKPLQYSFKTLDGLLSWLGRLDRGGWTTYYACASFKEFQVWDAKQQKFVRRTHDNILFIADLWMDVDTRESHPNVKYVNRREAEQAVLAFCQHLGLPQPLWVSSGGGLHVHWPLDAELELAEWEVYSRGLRAAADDFKLAIDERKTLDGSAVLRVPDSHNYKFTPPRLVEAGEAVPRYPLDRFAKLKEIGLVQHSRPRIASHVPSSDSPIARALIGTVYDDPSDPRSAARACAQLGAFVAQPGQFDDNFHFGVAGLCKVSCSGGGDIYLGWLAPEYRDAGRTKLDNWKSDAPPTCAYLESVSPFKELCKTCPHYGQITTPCELGRLAEKKIERLAAARGAPIQVKHQPDEGISQAVEGDLNGFPILSPPWSLVNGKICHVTEDKKGNPNVKVVCSHPIYLDGELKAEAQGDVFYCFKHKPPLEDWCSVALLAGDIQATPAKGLATLTNSGAHIRDNGLFIEYMRDQLDDWKSKNPFGKRYEQCGIKDKGKSFLSASNLYSNNGVERVAVANEVLIRERLGLGPQPGGDAREFLRTVNNLWVPDYYCGWLNMGLSYGSVLQPLLNEIQGSLLVVNWSPDSQIGKTVILYVCCAIWGLWDALSLKDHDTAPSMGLILASLGNLPGFVDEILHFTNGPEGVERLRKFLNMLIAGIDKHRALPYGVGVKIQTARWLLNLLTTANASVIDTMQAFGKSPDGDEANTNRYLEMRVPAWSFDQIRGPVLEQQLWRNAGWAGHEFLKYVMLDSTQAYLKRLIPEQHDLLWKRVGNQKEQRYRIGGLTLAAAAHQVLANMGMPLQCRLDEMVDWGIDQIRARFPVTTATERSADRAMEALDKFLRHNANNTLRVQDAYKKNLVQVPYGARPQKVMVRSEQNTARVYLITHEFKVFCVHSGYHWNDVQANLYERKLLLGQRKMTLTAGTEYSSAQVMCMEFDASHPLFTEALQPVSS